MWDERRSDGVSMVSSADVNLLPLKGAVDRATSSCRLPCPSPSVVEAASTDYIMIQTPRVNDDSLLMIVTE